MKAELKELLAKITNTPIIVETGTSGIWTYRKWSDGTAECWGLWSGTTGTFSSWFNGIYYKTIAINSAFPFTFTSEPNIFMSAHQNTAWLFILKTDRDATTLKGFTFASNASASITATFGFKAIGKWK